jgi:hypothetical protein
MEMATDGAKASSGRLSSPRRFGELQQSSLSTRDAANQIQDHSQLREKSGFEDEDDEDDLRAATA